VAQKRDIKLDVSGTLAECAGITIQKDGNSLVEIKLVRISIDKQHHY